MEVRALESPPVAGNESAEARSNAEFPSRAWAGFAGLYLKQSHCREYVLVCQLVGYHIFKDSALSAEKKKKEQIPEGGKKKKELNYIRDTDETYSISNDDVVE